MEAAEADIADAQSQSESDDDDLMATSEEYFLDDGSAGDGKGPKGGGKGVGSGDPAEAGAEPPAKKQKR